MRPKASLVTKARQTNVSSYHDWRRNQPRKSKISHEPWTVRNSEIPLKRRLGNGKNIAKKVSLIINSGRGHMLIYPAASKSTRKDMESTTVGGTIIGDEDRVISSVEAENSIFPLWANNQGSWSNASNAIYPIATNVVKVFPFSLCGAIVKHEWYTVMMEISPANSPTGDDQMTLQIVPNRVEHFAKELFGVHLVAEHGQWHRPLDDETAGMTHNDSMFFFGAKVEILEKMFGPLTRAAIEASVTRATETNEGMLKRTKCICMLVRIRSNEPAALSIVLGSEYSRKLKQLLFQY